MIQCRAADWNLSSPDWTGRMRVMEKNQKVTKTYFSVRISKEIGLVALVDERHLTLGALSRRVSDT